MATVRTQMDLRQAEQPAAAPRGVFIPQEEYNRLIRVDRLYGNLTRNLLNHGISEDMLALISSDDSTEEKSEAASRSTSGSTAEVSDKALPVHARLWLESSAATQTPPKTAEKADKGKKPETQDTPTRKILREFQRSWADSDSDTASVTTAGFTTTTTTESACEERTPLMKSSTPYRVPGMLNKRGFRTMREESLVYFGMNRTVQIFNVPEAATLADVTAAIRGGQLLEIQKLRAPIGAFEVSFVRVKDAGAFHAYYIHTHSLVVMGKKVSVRWADKQVPTNASLRRHIDLGFTRNIVISNYGLIHTEEMLRDDLEHIYCLEVLKIEFINRRCYIHTNSVDLAHVARTCMQSRLKYRGCDFAWAADECAEPLGTAPPTAAKATKAAAGPWSVSRPSPAFGPPSAARWRASMPLNPRANRFMPLNEDKSL